MGITRSTVRVGQKPTKEQLKQIREIAKKPIHYTEDCPESTPEALAEFAAMARARRKRKTKPLVALRVESEALEKYKALGEFAAMARARRQRKTKPMVALRVEPDALEKYKALGDGYTGIMADVLNYVANNPEILSRASGAAVAR